MRHMAARDLDRAGLPLQDIQAFLGHADPKTTQIYLDRLSQVAAAHTEQLLRVRKAAEAMALELVDDVDVT
jgi:site-specific recombinase XerD